MPNGAEQEVHLTLDFACCLCGEPVSVTVQCRGQGFSFGMEQAVPVVSVSVPCPGCGQVNQLFFDPTGLVRAVKPLRCFWPLPTPSVN